MKISLKSYALIVYSTVITSYSITIITPEQTVSYSTVTNEKDSSQKNQAAHGTWLSFQEESNQVEYHEHDMSLQQGWIHRFWY